MGEFSFSRKAPNFVCQIKPFEVFETCSCNGSGYGLWMLYVATTFLIYKFLPVGNHIDASFPCLLLLNVCSCQATLRFSFPKAFAFLFFHSINMACYSLSNIPATFQLLWNQQRGSCCMLGETFLFHQLTKLSVMRTWQLQFGAMRIGGDLVFYYDAHCGHNLNTALDA